MLKIENTPHYLGLKIKGDYYDLHTLYDAISRYTDLFYTEAVNQVELQSKEENWDDRERSYSIHYYSEMRDCILGLNYDIRHAWQGDRDFEYLDNNAEGIGQLAECIYEVDHELLDSARADGKNGNLYFSVEILYPWALYYIQCFNVMTDSFFSEEARSHLDYPYKELDYRKDTSVIEYFCYSVWECLIEMLGSKAKNMMDLADFTVEQPLGISRYYEALCNYYCDKNKNDPELRGAILQKIFYESLGEEWMEDDIIDEQLIRNCQSDIREAEAVIQSKTGKGFLSFPDYIEEEMAYFQDRQYSYEKKEAFMDQFGDVDWENIEW